MERVAPAGDVYQAGTLSGNPLATAAGLATLGCSTRRAYARLDRDHRRARRAASRRAATRGRRRRRRSRRRPASLTLFFAPEPPVVTTTTPGPATLDAYAAFCRGMLDRGVYLPPSQFEAWFPSLAHTDAHVERTLERGAARRWRSCERARRGRGGGRSRARCPRACASPGRAASSEVDGARGFVLEAVYEGYLLHYGEPRAFTGMDRDLRLLAGDALYALGLARLAETGDLEAVAVLSDLISATRAGSGRGPGRRRRGALGRRARRPWRDRLPPRR